MAFGSVGPQNEPEEKRVAQWLWQIAEDERRERTRKELAPVLDQLHFHVAARRAMPKMAVAS
jgi:hypothetical protein